MGDSCGLGWSSWVKKNLHMDGGNVVGARQERCVCVQSLLAVEPAEAYAKLLERK